MAVLRFGIGHVETRNRAWEAFPSIRSEDILVHGRDWCWSLI